MVAELMETNDGAAVAKVENYLQGMFFEKLEILRASNILCFAQRPNPTTSEKPVRKKPVKH